jgi:hypothetical protein
MQPAVRRRAALSLSLSLSIPLILCISCLMPPVSGTAPLPPRPRAPTLAMRLGIRQHLLARALDVAETDSTLSESDSMTLKRKLLETFERANAKSQMEPPHPASAVGSYRGYSVGHNSAAVVSDYHSDAKWQDPDAVYKASVTQQWDVARPNLDIAASGRSEQLTFGEPEAPHQRGFALGQAEESSEVSMKRYFQHESNPTPSDTAISSDPRYAYSTPTNQKQGVSTIAYDARYNRGNSFNVMPEDAYVANQDHVTRGHRSEERLRTSRSSSVTPGGDLSNSLSYRGSLAPTANYIGRDTTQSTRPNSAKRYDGMIDRSTRPSYGDFHSDMSLMRATTDGKASSGRISNRRKREPRRSRQLAATETYEVATQDDDSNLQRTFVPLGISMRTLLTPHITRNSDPDVNEATQDDKPVPVFVKSRRRTAKSAADKNYQETVARLKHRIRSSSLGEIGDLSSHSSDSSKHFHNDTVLEGMHMLWYRLSNAIGTLFADHGERDSSESSETSSRLTSDQVDDLVSEIMNQIQLRSQDEHNEHQQFLRRDKYWDDDVQQLSLESAQPAVNRVVEPVVGKHLDRIALPESKRRMRHKAAEILDDASLPDMDMKTSV